MRPAGGVDLVDDPIGGDRVDIGVQHDHAHVRGLGRSSRRQREPGEQSDGQKAQCAHRRAQPTCGRRGGRDADAGREAGAVRVAVALAAALLLAVPAAAAAQTRYAELAPSVPAAPGVHVLPPERAPFAFDLVGARWRADPGVAVDVRTRGAHGSWSPWTSLAPDGGGGPVTHSEPVWIAGSRVLQLRVRGAGLQRLHVALVAPDTRPLRPFRVPQAAPEQPPIISRAGWGADESLVRAPPRYADAVRMVFIHHTDTPNGYSPDEVPAIIRSIYAYHVRSNGWNDMGYNFLVDAYGRIYEGRAGGIDRPVIGAHTLGFNDGSVGIAVIGDGNTEGLTPAARTALVDLIAWRLDVAHVDPVGQATMVSDGNSRYPAGRTVSFRVVSGHRDALPTDCPGALIYPQLDSIAAAAEATGTPKIVNATAAPSGLGADASGHLVPIVFRAQVLGGASWTVTVLDAQGAPVASTSGSGADIAWSWNGTRSDGTALAPGTKLAYRIEAQDAAGESALPLLASLGALPTAAAAPPLSLAPAVISPDGDGVDDSLAIGYTLPAPSTVTLQVLAPDGTVMTTLVSAAALPAGSQSARWGAQGPAGLVADGVYTVQLSVTDATGQTAVRTGTVAVIRAARKLHLSRANAGPGMAVTATWQQTQPATMSATLSSPGLNSGAALLAGAYAPGPQSFTLDAGRLASLPDGTYDFVLTGQTAVGAQVLHASFRLDRKPPAARLVRLRVHGRSAFLAVRLSEPATVRVLAGARVVVPRRLRAAGRNGFRFRLPPGVPARLRLQLRDLAGNAARAGPFRVSSRRS